MFCDHEKPGYEVIKMLRLNGVENIARAIILYLIRSNSKKKFENRSDVVELRSFHSQQFERGHSGYVGADLVDISEDYSTESCNSLACSKR